MNRRIKIIIGATAVAAATAVGTGVALAGAGGEDAGERPITGDALAKAESAALEHTRGGRVSDTEEGDEESLYEVEVTRTDGSQVDVQLDKDFKVVGDKVDGDTAEES